MTFCVFILFGDHCTSRIYKFIPLPNLEIFGCYFFIYFMPNFLSPPLLGSHLHICSTIYIVPQILFMRVYNLSFSVLRFTKSLICYPPSPVWIVFTSYEIIIWVFLYSCYFSAEIHLFIVSIFSVISLRIVVIISLSFSIVFILWEQVTYSCFFTYWLILNSL